MHIIRRRGGFARPYIYGVSLGDAPLSLEAPPSRVMVSDTEADTTIYF